MTLRESRCSTVPLRPHVCHQRESKRAHTRHRCVRQRRALRVGLKSITETGPQLGINTRGNNAAAACEGKQVPQSGMHVKRSDEPPLVASDMCGGLRVLPKKGARQHKRDKGQVQVGGQLVEGIEGAVIGEEEQRRPRGPTAEQPREEPLQLEVEVAAPGETLAAHAVERRQRELGKRLVRRRAQEGEREREPPVCQRLTCNTDGASLIQLGCVLHARPP
mmetsp:Transcript_48589/g.112520  ORF Transcript_48589/g.112520 Transcript_48589/m.112520 type:complete len:220 (-) Transcript_48589:538-1197(-)